MNMEISSHVHVVGNGKILLYNRWPGHSCLSLITLAFDAVKLRLLASSFVPSQRASSSWMVWTSRLTSGGTPATAELERIPQLARNRPGSFSSAWRHTFNTVFQVQCIRLHKLPWCWHTINAGRTKSPRDRRSTLVCCNEAWSGIRIL